MHGGGNDCLDFFNDYVANLYIPSDYVELSVTNLQHSVNRCIPNFIILFEHKRRKTGGHVITLCTIVAQIFLI